MKFFLSIVILIENFVEEIAWEEYTNQRAHNRVHDYRQSDLDIIFHVNQGEQNAKYEHNCLENDLLLGLHSQVVKTDWSLIVFLINLTSIGVFNVTWILSLSIIGADVLILILVLVVDAFTKGFFFEFHPENEGWLFGYEKVRQAEDEEDRA